MRAALHVGSVRLAIATAAGGLPVLWLWPDTKTMTPTTGWPAQIKLADGIARKLQASKVA